MTAAEEVLPGVDGYAAALTDAHRTAIYRPVAQWLIDAGYPIDWHLTELPPTELWDAVVELVHEDADGRFHGRQLSREDVAAWLRYETTKPPAGKGV